MHSSRMRTIHSGGRREKGVSTQDGGVCVSAQGGIYPGVVCPFEASAGRVSAQEGLPREGVCPGVSAQMVSVQGVSAHCRCLPQYTPL